MLFSNCAEPAIRLVSRAGTANPNYPTYLLLLCYFDSTAGCLVEDAKLPNYLEEIIYRSAMYREKNFCIDYSKKWLKRVINRDSDVPWELSTHERTYRSKGIKIVFLLFRPFPFNWRKWITILLLSLAGYDLPGSYLEEFLSVNFLIFLLLRMIVFHYVIASDPFINTDGSFFLSVVVSQKCSEHVPRRYGSVSFGNRLRPSGEKPQKSTSFSFCLVLLSIVFSDRQ